MKNSLKLSSGLCSLVLLLSGCSHTSGPVDSSSTQKSFSNENTAVSQESGASTAMTTVFTADPFLIKEPPFDESQSSGSADSVSAYLYLRNDENALLELPAHSDSDAYGLVVLGSESGFIVLPYLQCQCEKPGAFLDSYYLVQDPDGDATVTAVPLLGPDGEPFKGLYGDGGDVVFSSGGDPAPQFAYVIQNGDYQGDPGHYSEAVWDYGFNHQQWYFVKNLEAGSTVFCSTYDDGRLDSLNEHAINIWKGALMVHEVPINPGAEDMGC